MSIDATVGGSVSDSLVTVEFADIVMANRVYGATWAGYTTDNKERALKTAAYLMTGLDWLGSRTTLTQALDFPRVGVDLVTANDAIPLGIQYAQVDLAFWLLKSDRFDDGGTETVTKLDADGVILEFGPRNGVIPKAVLSKLNPYLNSMAGLGQGITAPLARV